MSLVFADGWEKDNTSVPKMTQAEIEEKTLAALEALATTDKEFTYLKNITASTSTMAKTKVTKGLHQEEGNAIIPDSHITLEIADYPYPKRFHLYFWYIKKDKKTAWRPYKLTHIENGNRKSVDL